MNWTLTKKFSIISFIVIFIMGLILAFTISKYTEKHILEMHVMNTIDFSQKYLSRALNKDEYNQPLLASRANNITYFFKNYLPGEVKRIKVWNSQGTIIYSEKAELIGKKYPIEDELKEALNDHSVIGVSDLSKIDNVMEKGIAQELIEVYVPIKIEKEIVGVFELYLVSKPLRSEVSKVHRMVWLITATVLVVLYLTLYQVVKQGSDTIIDQAQTLLTLNKRVNQITNLQEQTYFGSLNALLVALEARDNYTAGHALRVTEYALLLGKHLGLDDESLKRLEEAALLHDIGKIGAPEGILNKESSLDQTEFDEMKKHCEIGANIVKALGCADDRVKIIRHHHERFDGLGYPEGLSGSEIPLESRILTVVDTYDALTSNRPYRDKLSHEEAVDILISYKGNRLQTEIVDLFIKLINDKQRYVKR